MFRQSIRLAARKVIRYPALAAVTALTITIAVAVSATIFTVTWSILVRPFPFADEDRLLQLWVNDPVGDIAKLELSFEEVEYLQKEAKTIEGVAAFSAANFPFVVKRGDEPMQLSTNNVGEPFFRTLGVKPALGRSFTKEEHKPGAPAVAILSDRAWRERFGGDPNIVGAKLTSDVAPIEIIGVFPKHFDLPAGAEIIFPLEPLISDDNGNRVLTAVVKMRPGVTMQDVANELRVISTHTPRTEADKRNVTITPYRLKDEILGSTDDAVRIMFGMGLLVLIIAILNTAAIALAQGVERVNELGIRSSVGATRTATALQLFAESFFITLLAALAGFGLAQMLLTTLLRLAPENIPRLGEIHVGPETLLFAIAAAFVAAAVAAVMQLLVGSDSQILQSIRSGAKATSGQGARRLLELLAAAQIAVAIVTIVVATLLIQSFRRYANIDVGFATDHVVTFHLQRGYVLNDAPEQKRAFFRDLLQRLRAIDGVEAAGSVLMRPLEVEQGWDFSHTIEGQDAAQQERNPFANFLCVTPGYFEAMGMRLARGRTFTDDDRPDSTKVAIVGESFARRYWGVDRAIGKRVKSGKPASDRPWLTVVGVVKDVRSRNLTTEKLDLYVPFTQEIWSPNYFAVRTKRDPESVIASIRSTVAQMDRNVPVASIRTSRQLVDAKLAQPRLSAVVVTIFAITASLLTLIGLYGVLAYGVRQRTTELGVRLAVGATSRHLIALITRRALTIALLGTIAGIAISVLADKWWRSFVYGIDGIDFGLTALLAVGFILVSLIASALPALRAGRVEAASALRAE